MEKLDIFEGDTVLIKGKRGKSTIATIAMLDNNDNDNKDVVGIHMTEDAMKNAGV
ncbi:hypothetical protein TrRE_jg1957, partial [Triparma retinervis]